MYLDAGLYISKMPTLMAGYRNFMQFIYG